VALDMGRGCPDAERLAEYADGVLGPADRAEIEGHLVDCADCRAVIGETMAFQQAHPVAASPKPAVVVPFRSRRWVTGAVAGLAAAAVLALAVRVVRPQWIDGLFGPSGGRPELEELIAALANEPTRPVEGRLTGGFKYAPPPSPTRGPGDREVAPDVRIAAAKIEKQAQAIETPANEAALGIAYLATGQFDKAIASLEESTAKDPQSALFSSDLSAAYIARATRQNTGSDWPKALAAAERAVTLNPNLIEAYFNRAIALEGLHLSDEAAAAWSAYLSADQKTSWAAEAQRRRDSVVRRLPPASRIELPRDRQADREHIEDRLLAEWAQSYLQADAVTAARALDDAEAAARRLIDSGGDALAHDELLVIRRAVRRGDEVLLGTLAEGHQLYAAARQEFLADHLQKASESMTAAASRFRTADSAFQWWGSIYEAILQRVSGRADACLAVLRTVPIDNLPRTYFHLRGRHAWTAAVAFGTLGRLDAAKAKAREAVDDFKSAQETENLSATQTHLAEVAWYLGDREEAWQSLIEALRNVDALHVTTRRNVILLKGASFSLSDTLPEAALHFQNALIHSLEDSSGSPGRVDAYLERARTWYRLGAIGNAQDDLRRAQQAVGAVVDGALRDKALADTDALAAETESGDFTRALDDINRALAFYTSRGRATRLSRLLQVRAGIRKKLGDAHAAGVDLVSATAAFEDDRASVGSAVDRMLAFQEQRGAYKALEIFEIERGRIEVAFDVAERGRAGSATGESSTSDQLPLSLSALTAQIPESVAAIYYLALPDRLHIGVFTRERTTFIVRNMPLPTLRSSVSRFVKAILRGADLESAGRCCSDLLEEVVQPALAASGAATTLVFIPDDALHSIPFAALANRAGTPLGETYTVAVAPSLTAFVRASSKLTTFSPDRVVALSDGHDPSTSGLPRLVHADREAADVAAGYRRAVVLIGLDATRDRLLTADAPVVHFAGHTVVNQRFPLFSRLLLAGRDGDDGTLTSSDVLSARFDKTAVIVLATCDGAAPTAVGDEMSLSVAGSFLAAGVPSVVANLWPVEDDTHGLLIGFHRELRRLADPAAALRAAQTAFVAANRHAPIRTWGGFVALGGVRPLSH
jgi:CHAT domain-containing protein